MELEAEFDRLQLRTSDSQDETKQPGEADLALLCLPLSLTGSLSCVVHGFDPFVNLYDPV